MSITPLLHTDLDAQLAGLVDAPRWFVGFSGGVDSTVLLYLLRQWCRANAAAPPLTAVHVNHGMQDAADQWQEHCERTCSLLQVPFVSRTVQVSAPGSEAAAREARYRVFAQQLRRAEVLFLGHHLDDQVETFFLRLLRGAGVQGLAAIPPRRTLGEGQVVRPLLQITREQLQHYAHHHGLDHVQDPSNEDTRADRNFLRAELLPLLASRWPAYRQTVARASEHMADAVQLLEEALPPPQTVYSAMGDPGMSLAELVSAPVAAAAVRLRGWLRAGCRQAPDQSSMEEFLRQLQQAGADATPRLECSAYTLQRYRAGIYLYRVDPDGLCTDRIPLSPGENYRIPGVGRVGLEPASSGGLLLRPTERLELAWRQGGERCRPRGRAGSNSLKKLLQEWDVPPWWRDRVPLLYLGDELLAAGDLWVCDSDRWRDRAARGESLWRLTWERNNDKQLD